MLYRTLTFLNALNVASLLYSLCVERPQACTDTCSVAIHSHDEMRWVWDVVSAGRTYMTASDDVPEFDVASPSLDVAATDVIAL